MNKEPLTLIGIDPGLRWIAWALLADGRYSAGEFSPSIDEGASPEEQVASQLAQGGDFLTWFLHGHLPDVVGVERGFGPMLNGEEIALGACGRLGCRVFRLTKQSARKALTGHGNATDGKVREVAREILGRDKVSLHEADALAVLKAMEVRLDAELAAGPSDT